MGELNALVALAHTDIPKGLRNPTPELAETAAEFTAAWGATHALDSGDWAAGLQAYARAQVATLALAGHKKFGDALTGKLRHLARRAALHIDRLAHTPHDEPDLAFIDALAHRAYEPYTTTEELTQALADLQNQIDTSGDPLSRARLDAARAPQGELAHLVAVDALARAVFDGPVPRSRSEGPLPTHLGRLAHTLLTNPAIAHAPLAEQTRPLEAVYRDLPPAAPYGTADGEVDETAMEQAHESVTAWAKRAAEQCRKQTTSAAERRLAATCAQIQQRPLVHSLDGAVHAFWPHLLATAADLARQVMGEHKDEQERAYREETSPTSPSGPCGTRGACTPPSSRPAVPSTRRYRSSRAQRSTTRPSSPPWARPHPT